MKHKSTQQQDVKKTSGTMPNRGTVTTSVEPLIGNHTEDPPMVAAKQKITTHLQAYTPREQFEAERHPKGNDKPPAAPLSRESRREAAQRARAEAYRTAHALADESYYLDVELEGLEYFIEDIPDDAAKPYQDRSDKIRARQAEIAPLLYRAALEFWARDLEATLLGAPEANNFMRYNLENKPDDYEVERADPLWTELNFDIENFGSMVYGQLASIGIEHPGMTLTQARITTSSK